MLSKALVIIDVQNDFLPGGNLPVPLGHEVIAPINHIMTKFDCVVATKDWHPVKHISFSSRHRQAVGSKVFVKDYWQELWPDHCVANSQGAAFPRGLNVDSIFKTFYKGTALDADSYSAFYDNRGLAETGLASYLRGLFIESLYLVGLATDFCVKASVEDALKLGFETCVIREGCRAIGEAEQALISMQSAGANIMTLSDLWW